jgi:hypothetical protein
VTLRLSVARQRWFSLRTVAVGGVVEPSPAGRVLPPRSPTATRRYAYEQRISSGLKGHVTESRKRDVMPFAAECLKERRDERDVVDRLLRAIFDVPPQPAHRDPAAPLRLLNRDQRRQLERLIEPNVSHLLEGLFCDKRILAHYRTLKNTSRMAFRSQRIPLSGAGPRYAREPT